MTRRTLIRLLVGFLCLVVGFRIITMMSSVPDNLGARNGKLADLPESRNCVSSQVARHNDRFIDPLRLPADPGGAMQELATLVDAMPRSTLVTQTSGYLHFEFRSLVFGFVDDVEFQVDSVRKVIDVRSASRFGYSDLGVNRRRVETIRQRWENR